MTEKNVSIGYRWSALVVIICFCIGHFIYQTYNIQLHQLTKAAEKAAEKTTEKTTEKTIPRYKLGEIEYERVWVMWLAITACFLPFLILADVLFSGTIHFGQQGKNGKPGRKIWTVLTFFAVAQGVMMLFTSYLYINPAVSNWQILGVVLVILGYGISKYHKDTTNN